MRNFFGRHFLDHLFHGDRGIRVASNRAEHVPHIRPREIGRRHSEAHFIVPTDPRLSARMPFHGTAKVPFEGTHVVLLNTETQGVHDADQLLSVRVSGPRRRPKGLKRLFETTGLHQIARLFNLSGRRRREKRKYHQKLAHVLALCVIASPSVAERISADDFLPFNEDQAKIGQLLFYDKILSGNLNISCGTCHHHTMHGGDGLSLGIGEGGEGLGPERTAGSGADRIKKRVPRSAPTLWNLGHKDVRVLFHDGRLSISDLYGNGFNSPAEEWLPEGLDNILAAQAVLPMTAQFEMAGNPKENEVAGAVHDRIDAAWPIIAKRVRVIPAYGDMFVAAFDHIEAADEVTIVEIANALGAFIGREWQSFDSPYDAWLDGKPLPAAAERGRELFFGKAGCAGCHNGPLFSDQEFHALGLPAFGPGRTRRFDPVPRDVGRMGETDRLEDAYRFRTPSLRNVALTAPYGHNGAYQTLGGMLRHHRDPVASRAAWTRDMAKLPQAEWLQAIDFVIQSDTREMQRQVAKLDLTGINVTDAELEDLEAFLHALTGETAETRPLGRPDTVPSGLPVD